MEDGIKDKWERFLTPEILRSNLLMASVYLVIYEKFKKIIIERIREFYCNGFKDGEWIVDSDYQEKVISRNKSLLYASLLWYLEIGAIADQDLRDFEEVKSFRNSIAHELDNLIIEGIPTDIVNNFNKLNSLFEKIEKWWFMNVELLVNPYLSDVEIKELDMDKVVSSSIATNQLLIQVAFGNDEDAEKYIKLFKESGLIK